MIKSEITGKVYEPSTAIYMTNPVQTFRYLDYLGSEYLLDIIWNSEKRKDTLVFVWQKCPETQKAKELWDQHLL